MTFAIVNERQKASVAVAIAFLILPTSAVGLRILARRVQRTSFTSSDYCIFAALVCNWAISSLAIVNVVHGGVGEHQDKVSIDAIKTFLSSLFAIELLWAAAEGLIKTSMCLLYMQIFRIRWFRIASYITIGVCNAFAIMVILSTTFICTPIQLSFDPTLKGTCGNRNALWLTIGVLNIFTDLLVVMLPLPSLLRLQIPRHKKIALLFIFSFGLFVCIVSCIRLQYLLAVDFNGDMTFTVANAVIWSLLEPTLAVTVGCLPTIVPLFRRWFPSTGSTDRPVKSGSIPLGTMDTMSQKELFPTAGSERTYEPTVSHTISAAGKPIANAQDASDKRWHADGAGYDMSTKEPDTGINVVTEWVVSRDESDVVNPRAAV